jgi:hypothetical protein
VFFSPQDFLEFSLEPPKFEPQLFLDKPQTFLMSPVMEPGSNQLDVNFAYECLIRHYTVALVIHETPASYEIDAACNHKDRTEDVEDSRTDTTGHRKFCA